MKTSRLIMALMLLCSVSALAEDVKYTVTSRTGLQKANKNGLLQFDHQEALPGQKVTITCAPSQNFGLSRGVFYAIKNSNGTYSPTKTATEESIYPENRANSLTFSFTMPAGDVEAWAFFEPLRQTVVHKAPHGKLEPLYGRTVSGPDSVVYNVPFRPVKLKVVPDDGYELVDVNTVNIEASNCEKSSDFITVRMTNKDVISHITPIFGKKKYDVNIKGNTPYVKVELDNPAPKSREEVKVTLTSERGYIPSGFSITGCESWWSVGRPQQQSDGRWKAVYRFKTGLQDITIHVNHEKVYSLTVNDTQQSGRVQTYIPEMIPGYPGMARSGQQVPVVFRMPAACRAKYTARGAQSPLVFHNALHNSFADEDMLGWTETSDYVGAGLPIRVDADSAGNRFWRTSVSNSMSQSVSLSGRSFPEKAKNDGLLTIAAIASINPNYGKMIETAVVAKGTNKAYSRLAVADLQSLGNKEDCWQTILKTGKIDANASELKFTITSQADSQNGKDSHDGPMFDDLCLLLPTAGDSIKDEDVLIFTVGGSDVTIDYTPLTGQAKVSAVKKEHVTVTLLNSTTGEQGETVSAMKNDIIVVKGKYDEGYAIYRMDCRQNKKSAKLPLDRADIAARENEYHFVMLEDKDVTVTPTVNVLKVNTEECYGGTVEVSNRRAKSGEKVVVTITTDSGSKLKQIRTIPAGIVTLTPDNVDASGAGTYSFVMPAINIKLIPEFIVSITSAQQLSSIHEQYGDFVLDSDLDLGDHWNNYISLWGHFNGNGHKITYGGSSSLFFNINRNASVRHLYVSANVKGSATTLGGIAIQNEGIIEDCEVRGTVKNENRYYSVAGAVAGQNGPGGGTISHCHVVCEVIDAPMAYGIACQGSGATIRDNVFCGKFPDSDGQAYMICNDEKNSTVEGNSYIANDGNSRAMFGTGVTAEKPDNIIQTASNMADAYPVFAASIQNRYNAFTVKTSLSGEVELLSLSSETAVAGAEIRGSVRVSGNNHLERIVVSAPDGSNPQSCKFEDNTENDYFFSFIMPDHNVLVTFQTAVGTLIYNTRQFINIDDQQGTYILASDIELNNWEKEMHLNGLLYGNGHTIKYNASGSVKGLFSRIRKNALLEGVRVVGNVTSINDCAGIAYENYGTIRDCHFRGNISKIASPNISVNRVAAIACKVGVKSSLIDHCSATGKLASPGAENQATVDKYPLCGQSDAYEKNIVNSDWISDTQSSLYQELLNRADASRHKYPVYAQGIFDEISVQIVTGSDTLRVLKGTTLDEYTITDGIPFSCTSDVKVNRVIYKRQPMKALEPWVLPFGFNQMAGSGTFEYHQTAVDENNMPALRPGKVLTLTDTPSSITYKANEPWMVVSDGSDVRSYVLTCSDGPITIKPSSENFIGQYASATDIGNLYATYNGIPAAKATKELMYTWNQSKRRFDLSTDSNSVDIQPFRFYLQFYNKNSQQLIRYEDTWWYTKCGDAGARGRERRRLASAAADGWQPVILDPRQPQSITARMLNYYEVAYLADIHSEIVDEQGSEERLLDPGENQEPVPATLIYQIANSRMELPPAIPLLVRAKRSDAEPLVDQQTAEEIEALLLQSMMHDDEEDEDESNSSDFYIPHYWCASLGMRLDIWPLPSSERYADMADSGFMMFDDNYYDQTFINTTHSDTRTSAPMSYCITVLNTETYELLPLLGNRVTVEFIKPADETTGIEGAGARGCEGAGAQGCEGAYSLTGQRVNASYKGVILQNGRKYIRR